MRWAEWHIPASQFNSANSLFSNNAAQLLFCWCCCKTQDLMWLVWVVWLGFGWFFGGVRGAGLFGRVLFRFVGVFFSNYIKSIASLFWGNCSGREDILPDIFPPSRDCLLICLQLHMWLRCMKSLNCLDYMMWRRAMCNWEEKWRPSRAGMCTVWALLAFWVAECEQTPHSLEVGKGRWAVFSSHLLHAPLSVALGYYWGGQWASRMTHPLPW